MSLLDSWNCLNVLVIGDVMLDSYLYGRADRLAQEAPVPVVAVTERQDFPGGAANAAANVASLGATVHLLSVVGTDAEGDRLRQTLVQRSISTQGLLRSDRATLAKQRVLANSQLVVRFDQGSTDAIAPDLEQRLIDQLEELYPRCQAAIVSDYSYGILTPRIVQALAVLQAQHPRTLVVDAKQLGAYRAVQPTAIKPNYREAIHLLGLPAQTHDRAEQLAPYADRLLNLTGARIVAVTLDSEGAIVVERGHDPFCIPTQPVPQTQTSGAGDTFISALTLALASGASTRAATDLAIAAAAIVTTQIGTATCSIDALNQLIAVRY